MIPIEFLPHCQAVPLGVMVRGIMESLLDAGGSSPKKSFSGSMRPNNSPSR